MIKRATPLALAVLGATTLCAQVIQLDFGSSSILSGAGWNNVDESTTTIASLVDSSGTPTGISFAIAGYNTAPNSSGTNAGLDAWPGTATGDNLYGNLSSWSGQVCPEITIDFGNLDPTSSYDFAIFASRMGVSDNRSALYSFSGSTTGSAVLDAANNTSTVAVVAGIVPTPGGTIALSITPDASNTNGTGFYYIGLMELSGSLSAIPEPGFLTSLIGLGALGLCLRRRR